MLPMPLNMNTSTRKTKDGVQGWLKRKGGALKTWPRRWCVLNDKCFFLYNREDDQKPQDIITLDKQIIVEPPADYNDPKQGYFDIVSEPQKEKPDVLHLLAETEEEKKLWIHSLKKALYANKGGALFSQSLEDIIFWEKKEGRRIPYIVDECVEYLYKYGLDVEGLFRLPGRQTSVKDIIARFEQGQKVSFEDSGTDVHVVASVLKNFLRELPDSLIPCDLFQKFMNIALRFMSAKTDEEKEGFVGELSSAMKMIPQDNYVILKYICNFLREVGLHENQNKMSMSSLGRIFGYNIIRHIDRENSQLFLCTADLSENLVFMLLFYFDQVFMLEYNEDSAPEFAVPTADLLHMSHVLDIPVVAPSAKPSSFADLEGININVSPPGSNKSSESSMKITEDYYSPVDPSKPLPGCANFPFADDQVFAETRVPKPAARKKVLHLSLSEPHGTRNTTSPPISPSSPCPNDGEPPVAPKRTKSTKLSRNRRALDRKRPEGYVMVDGQKSPRSPGALEGVNTQDVLTALAKANIPARGSPNASPSSTLSRCSSNNDSEQDGVASSFEILSSVPESLKSTTETKVKMNGKLELRCEDLSSQVETLKKELSDQKTRYKERVGALKAQLKDMREKYERRIETMQTEAASQRQDLENKLASERETCSAAVANTYKLREELHRYQMQYGELPF
ncbi:rho GTPase-activating protein 24 [Aplysia californica]|uniref:Rho GTPase-activating protein 24 n=1 Tax=Aplysia californica TaxID=6500 RepID=A0ABM1VUL4_APLCA|nr:rho GTPase-activating protein 24 [Aplysia californica]XP_035826106.1 rho GTPase-activating protein 24 [Aplysia californica]